MHASSEKCMVLPVTESYGGVVKWFSHVNQAACKCVFFPFLCILFYLKLQVSICVSVLQYTCRDERTISGNQFSCTVWIPGIDHGL